MHKILRGLVLAVGGLAALTPAAAQTAAQASASRPAAAEELRRLCETVSMSPIDGKEMARRAECVLTGTLPSPDRIAEARVLARGALNAGEPTGGLMLYLVYQQDPAQQAVRDGKLDAAAYQRLAARNAAQRREQIEAIEALGFAAGKGNVPAGMLLAAYFHDTIAPRNVARLGAMAALLRRGGANDPVIERFAREADSIARTAPATKASARAFLEAYRHAEAAARLGLRTQGVPACEQLQLQSVRAGEIRDAGYLPLTGTLVADSYLARGHWDETWTFQACGREVPVKVTFQADGGGGSATTAVPHPGS